MWHFRRQKLKKKPAKTSSFFFVCLLLLCSCCCIFLFTCPFTSVLISFYKFARGRMSGDACILSCLTYVGSVCVCVLLSTRACSSTAASTCSWLSVFIVSHDKHLKISFNLLTLYPPFSREADAFIAVRLIDDKSNDTGKRMSQYPRTWLLTPGTRLLKASQLFIPHFFLPLRWEWRRLSASGESSWLPRVIKEKAR